MFSSAPELMGGSPFGLQNVNIPLSLFPLPRRGGQRKEGGG